MARAADDLDVARQLPAARAALDRRFEAELAEARERDAHAVARRVTLRLLARPAGGEGRVRVLLRREEGLENAARRVVRCEVDSLRVVQGKPPSVRTDGERAPTWAREARSQDSMDEQRIERVGRR